MHRYWLTKSLSAIDGQCFSSPFHCLCSVFSFVLLSLLWSLLYYSLRIHNVLQWLFNTECLFSLPEMHESFMTTFLLCHFFLFFSYFCFFYFFSQIDSFEQKLENSTFLKITFTFSLFFCTEKTQKKDVWIEVLFLIFFNILL